MSNMSLTPNQIAVLACIKASFDARGYAPTFQEMRETCGFKSNSQVHRLVTALEKRGHIHRIPNCARAIAVGPAPEPRHLGRCPHCGGQIAAPVSST